MTAIAHYWTFITLDPTGKSRAREMPAAKTFFQKDVSSTLESDVDIQRSLMEIAIGNSERPENQVAILCLRCFISHQIEQNCRQLESKFGKFYGFTRYDLFAFVLDDDGKTPFSIREPTISKPERTNLYLPLAGKILQSFDPDRSQLSTWVTRLVKSHHELERFLLERGLCMLSDWALLNDTQPQKLQRVLGLYYQLTDREVMQAQTLLTCYHAVYRRDRLQHRQKGMCPPPTDTQLEEISQLVQQQLGLTHSPKLLRRQLEGLANRLREYRIATRGGSPSGQSLDQPDAPPLADTTPTDALNEPDERSTFLQFYRQQLLTGLETAFAQIVSDRIRTQKPDKSQMFLQALQLFHCQGASMTAIAEVIGLQAQYQVTRLLKLKEFRADVRHYLLQHLKQIIKDKALDYTSPNQLDQLDNRLEVALSEQIDTVIQQDQATAKTPKNYAVTSLFARILCQYLDQQIELSSQSNRSVSHE